MAVSVPQPIGNDHILKAFDCGQESLNVWLAKRALKNEGPASRTYVVLSGNNVIGYYCLSAGSIVNSAAPGKLRRNMPDPIPVIVLGRLAVDKKYKGQNIGSSLLRDALIRCNTVQESVGSRAIIVHALGEEAKQFYLKYGFKDFPKQPMTLYLPLPVF